MDRIDTNKIKEMTNLKVSYDIFIREEDLRKHKMKKIVFGFTFCFLVIAGTISLDALTDNSISNGIKDFFKIKVNGEDYNAKCDRTENGTYKCNINDKLEDGQEILFEVDENNTGNLSVDVKDNEVNFTFDEIIQ